MSYKPVDTAIVMVVGPCIDNTDFKSLEEAIAYNAAGMDVSLIVEKTDGTTAVTAITLTTAGTSDWTHKDGGYYEIEVTAAQNAEEGIAYVRGVCTGVLPFESIHYNVVKANVYDSWIKGTDVLQTDVTQWLGTAAATPTVAGVPEVDLTHWLGTGVSVNVAGKPTVDVTNIGASSQSLIDLKDFVDSGYDPATNKVQGVVLVDTTTTNTDLVSAADVVNEWETQSQADPTGFHVNVLEIGGTAQTANDNGADINAILTDTNELQTDWVNGGRLDLILDIIAADTTTDIPALIADVPTVAEFEARTIAADDYVVVGDTLAAVTTVTNLTNAPTNGDLTATMKTSVNTEVDTALTDINLDHLVKSAVDTNFATTVQLDSVIGQMVDVGTSATFDRTTDSNEAIRNKQTDIETDTGEIGTAGAGLTDLGGMSTGMKAEVNAEADTALTDYDPPTDTEMIARTLPTADYVVTSDTIAGVTTATNLTNAPTNGDLTATMKTSVNAEAKDVLTVDTIADSYATDGNQPTIAQAILAIQQMMQDKSISGTTLTVKKPDGSTTAMTFTLDSATTPTSITRAT